MPIHVRRQDNLKDTVAEQKIGEGISDGFDSLGKQIVPSLRQRARQDTHRHEKSIRHRISGRGLKTRMLIYAGAKHSEYVENDRPPGSYAPPDNIKRWCRRHGIPEERAYAINNKIFRKGIKGQHHFRDLRIDYASQISAAMAKINNLVARNLNG